MAPLWASLTGLVPIRDSWLLTVAVALLTAAAAVLAQMAASRPRLPRDAPRLLAGWPVLGSLDFFRSRCDFLVRGRRLDPSRQFSFYYGPHPVVAVSGPAARASFYNTRGLDLSAGFSGLFAASPNIDHLHRGDDLGSLFLSNFRRFLLRDRLEANLPKLVADADAAVADVAAAAAVSAPAVVDPFAVMLPLIYRLTHRTLGCNDVADDPKLLAQTLGHFGRLDQSSGLEIMFPRLLTPSKLRKMAAGLSLHRTFVRIMDGRRRSGRKETDAMQTLMEQGTDDILISTFIIGALFAGLVNSTFNAAWILCHCADQPAWYARVRAEVDAAVARHRRSADETAPEVLRRLPMAAWESEFPLVDVCLRETIRMIGRGASMRKNLSGKDIPIGDTGQVIPKDAYAICGMEDAHMDETLYKDPETWDPDRYLPGRDEDKKSPVAYLGWGAGLHPCLGMRFAKLEIIMTTAFFFAHYDFRRCDKQGADAADALPVVDRGGIGEKLPVRDIFLACTPRT